jgi:transposase-like protein
MVRTYKRKTERGRAAKEVFEWAAEAVENGESIRIVSRNLGLPKTTLFRFLNQRKKDDKCHVGYQGTKNAHLVLTAQMETIDLAEHVMKLSRMFFGLSKLNVQQLAFEFARHNNVNVPESWSEHGHAGGSAFLAIMV